MYYPTGNTITYVCLNQFRFRQIRQKKKHFRQRPFFDPQYCGTRIGRRSTKSYRGSRVRVTTNVLYTKKYSLLKDSKIILYPSRVLSRKNPYEALLLRKLAGEKYHLLFSLDGNGSEYEKRFVRFLREKKINASVGFGKFLEENKIPFPVSTLYSLCHCVVQTAVSEGFGYGFVQPVLYQRSIIARAVPEATDDFQANGLRPDLLYDKLPVYRKETFMDFALLQEEEQKSIVATKDTKTNVEPEWKHKLSDALQVLL